MKPQSRRYLLFSARGLACFRRDIVAMLGVAASALSPTLPLKGDDTQYYSANFSHNSVKCYSHWALFELSYLYQSNSLFSSEK
jgi:hypothetical protein